MRNVGRPVDFTRRRSGARDKSRFARYRAGRGPAVLFYDGQCGLCVRSKVWLEFSTSPDVLDFVDVRDEEEMSHFPQIDRDRAMETVTMLMPDGAQAHGYEAAIHAMRFVRGKRWLARFMRFGPVRFVGRRVYKFVTKRRHRLSRLLGWQPP